MQPEDWRRLKHFTPSEFAFPDKMGAEFMVWLDEVRSLAGVPMVVTSSYRAPAYNKKVGGAKDSAHTDVPCEAVDLGMRPRPDDPNWNHTRFHIIRAAIALGCLRIGTYANGSLHLDRSEDHRPAPRMWRMVGHERKQ